MSTKEKNTDLQEISIEEKLKALFELQQVDSKIDEIKRLRGELPLEVQDLEDDIAGFSTRIQNIQDEIKKLETASSNKKNEIKDCEAQIKKYTTQLEKVKNNREYDSLSKEIEFQKLEIQLAEKRIKEFQAQVADKKAALEEAKQILEERRKDLDDKKNELNSIINDTKKDEEEMSTKSKDLEKIIEPRLLAAYKRIRKGSRNGLAVVAIERDACGGCYNKIPPQRQLEVATRKKIIVCEYCGRVLVDKDFVQSEEKL